MQVACLAWLAFFDLLPSETKVDEHWPTPLVDVVVCNYENWKFLYRLTNVGYSVARPGEIPELRCHQWRHVASFAYGDTVTHTKKFQ